LKLSLEALGSIEKTAAVSPLNDPLERRSDWRKNPGLQTLPGRVANRLAGVALTLAAFGFLALAIWLFVSPLFRWQTAFVTLAAKDYHLGTVGPVPFLAEDLAAFTESLSPALNSRLGNKPVALSGMESVESLRRLLAGRIVTLPLRPKDVLVAYVRGQSIVMPPALAPDEKPSSDDERLAGKACMLSADFRVHGDRPREVIAWREIAELLGNGWLSQTLIAIDLGDLEWDPRLGVLASVVAKQLDIDFSTRQVSAVGENWIIGSHDLFGSSMAHPAARRTLFARALELGLSGNSDSKPWGNENGIVELDELAYFMTSQITHWSVEITGGRSQQKPVIWKLGVGRVPIADIPKGIAIIRVAGTRRPESGRIWGLGWGGTKGESLAAPATPTSAPEQGTPGKTAQSESARQPAGGREPSGKAPVNPVSGTLATAAETPELPSIPGDPSPLSPAAKPSAEGPPKAATAVVADALPPQAGKASTPTAATPTGAEKTSGLQSVGVQLDRLNARRTAINARDSRLLPLDYAPHVWNRLAKTVREADVRLRIAEGLFATEEVARVSGLPQPAAGAAPGDADARRMRVFLEEIGRQLATLPSDSSATPPDITETTQSDSVIVDDLKAARAAAENRDLFRRWSLAPPLLRNAIAIRDDAVTTAFETVDFIGKFSSGAGATIIDPLICRALAEHARDVSRLLAELDGSSPGSDDPRSVRLKVAIRACEAQTVWLKELVERSVLPIGKRSLRYLPNGATDSSLSFRRWRAAQQSLLFSENERSQLRLKGFPQFTAEQAAPATGVGSTTSAQGGPLQPVGLDRLPVESPVRVDTRSLTIIAQLIQSLATAADAAGIDAASTKDPPKELLATIREIAALRTEAAALVNLAGNETAAINGIVRLGGRAARTMNSVAAAIARASPGAGSRLDGSDQMSSLLRIVDYRDVAALPRNLLVTLPLSSAQAQAEIAFQTPEGVQLRRDAELRVVVEFSRLGDTPSLDRILRLNYDPAVIEVRAANGVVMQPEAPLDVQKLGLQGTALELRLRKTGVQPSIGTSELVQLVAVWELGQNSQRAVLDLKLPDRRDIVLAARRTPVAPSRSKVNLRQFAVPPRDDWDFSAPIRSGTDAGSAMVSTMVLSAIPGRITSWELGLLNTASVEREVSLEIHSLPRSSDPSSRESAWRDAAAALLAGTWHGEPIAAIPKLSLASSTDIVRIEIPPAPAAPPSPAAPASQTAGSSKDAPVGPDLAVIVRDSTPGQPPEVWLTRLVLTPEHPRSWVDASATWNPSDRTIVVTVAADKNMGAEAVAGMAGAENGVVSLEALTWGPAPRQQPLLIRKAAAMLGPGRLLDTMVATWNGGAQDGRAWLHVGVNGYPRAFVFAVDCSPAAAGEIQRPQFDWRCLSIQRPAEKQVVLKAPVADLPIKVAVDVPADASGDGSAAASAISLSMREVNAGMGSGIVHPVWKTSEDRQAVFTREKALGRATLAVKTVVQDWEINAGGLGFKDVDVVAEVALNVPGAQTPLTDRRLFTMDARPPLVEVPPLMNVVIGRPLVVPVRVTDDPRESSTRVPGSHIAGVSGVAKVEWGLDLKGDGAPAAWEPAVGLGGDMYEVRLDTTKIPPGTRLPLFVRATDRVGLSNTPEPVWLDSAPAVAKNGIRGKVMLNGLAEEGVLVSLSGQGPPTVMTSGADGVFEFPDLDPGEYMLQATGAVRNRSYRSEEAKVSVQAPPAPEVNITLQLK